ncbi:MgtC/SapB family protein [Methylobacter svalbardensis]|uniref:MgtC/SapB family protein n=1 Tax=Methylobacter svalbardensis TaxID=3080016 RepID=UPI0030EDB6FC
MKWLFEDWYHLLVAPWAHTALVVCAILCGTLIGAEREKNSKPAGLRTMILIALGSTLFTMVSYQLAGDDGDRGRVAAQIVSGIGFLGTGAILHDTVRIRGLTTAATIWVMAALGMLCGVGYGGAAIGLTCAVLLLLILLTQVENRYLGPCYYANVALIYDDDGGKTSVKVDSVLEDYRIPPSSINKTLNENGMVELTLIYCNAHKHHKAFLMKFSEMPEIKSIKRSD